MGPTPQIIAYSLVQISGSTTESTENLVARLLRSRGLEVKHIEEGTTRTPDLLVFDRTCKYLIEIKDKFPDAEKMRRREEVLNTGQIWEEQAELTYNNRISDVIREGVAQLSDFQTEPVDFRLLWLHARHHHEEMQLSQFQATLYGTVDLLDKAEIGATVCARPCYFFTFAEFYRHKDLVDGAFVATDDKCLLCLNSCSPRFERLKNSQLCQVLPGICDPMDLEQKGEAYVADCDLSRKDLASVFNYVKRKYNRPGLIEFQPTHYSGEISVPWSLDDAVE